MKVKIHTTVIPKLKEGEALFVHVDLDHHEIQKMSRLTILGILSSIRREFKNQFSQGVPVIVTARKDTRVLTVEPLESKEHFIEVLTGEDYRVNSD